MKNANQSAFPVPPDVLCVDSVPVDGLTKREYFAAMAMQGIMSNPSVFQLSKYISQTSLRILSGPQTNFSSNSKSNNSPTL